MLYKLWNTIKLKILYRKRILGSGTYTAFNKNTGEKISASNNSTILLYEPRFLREGKVILQRTK